MTNIQRIEAIGLTGATPAGGWSAELKPDDVVHTVVKVYTDDGLVGVGSVFSEDQLVRAALGVLEPLYRGESAIEPERVSEKLHQNTFWLGRGGTITHAISGIDIALWDILGQVTSQPLWRLLGGSYRDRVQPYASVLMDEPAKLTDDLIALREQGFRAYKIGWGPYGRVSDRYDEEIVAAAREAVGEDALLAVDAGGSDAFWAGDLRWALRSAAMLQHHDVAWFEEALVPDAVHEFAEFRRQSPVPVSGGEVLTRRQSFAPFFAAHSFDIVQPDTTKVGGLSEARRIAWSAAEHDVRFIPHGWNTALGLAADLHLAAALPGTDLVEYKTGSPYIDELTTPSWKLDDDGMLAVPTDPGLGVTLNDEAMARYGTTR